MAMYQIIDAEIDAASWLRVRVGINGETVTFKFDVLPADADVQAAAERYAAMTQEQAHAPADTD